MQKGICHLDKSGHDITNLRKTVIDSFCQAPVHSLTKYEAGGKVTSEHVRSILNDEFFDGFRNLALRNTDVE